MPTLISVYSSKKSGSTSDVIRAFARSWILGDIGRISYGRLDEENFECFTIFMSSTSTK